ncbi:UNVERIFIED_CONTAM: hypothetical protein PYX00_003831 [Menopon gallinae]|uniref:Uncharacterized protein n=1 Tax=Menopon gallinae TaxID=328185 RepID=A0AAW2I1J8_9NEOP
MCRCLARCTKSNFEFSTGARGIIHFKVKIELSNFRCIREDNAVVYATLFRESPRFQYFRDCTRRSDIELREPAGNVKYTARHRMCDPPSDFPA